MKLITKISLLITIFILLLVLMIWVIIKLPSVQTALVKKATQYLSHKLNTTVTIGAVNIEFLNKIVLEDILIKDLHNDTIIHAKAIKLAITKIDLDKNEIKASKTILKNAVIKIAKYPKEKGLNFQFIVDAFANKKNKDTNDSSSKIYCNEVYLDQVRFEYNDHRKKRGTPGYVDWDYLQFNNLNGNISNIDFIGDSVRCYLNELSFKEKSGFEVKRISAKTVFASNKMQFSQMRIKTVDSDINGSITFNVNTYEDFEDFFEKVNIISHLKNTQLNLKDLIPFAKELTGLNKLLTIDNLELTGTVNDFVARNVDISFGNKTNIKGRVSMNGLPDVNNTLIDFRIKELTTNAQDIEGIPMPPFTKNKYIKLPPEAFKLGTINYTGDYTGFYYDFVTYGKFKTAMGNGETDIDIKYDLEKETTSYKGNLKSQNFKLGQLLQIQDLGAVSLKGKIEGYEFDAASAKVKFEGDIADLEYKNYNYKNINLNGAFARHIFKGKINSKDANANFSFDGSIDYTKKFPRLNFKTQLFNLDLYKTNLAIKISPTTLKGKISIDFNGTKVDDAIGNATVEDLILNFNNKQYYIGNIDVSADLQNKNAKFLHLNSSFVDADINGLFNFTQLGESFKNLANHYLSNFESFKELKSKPTNDIFSYEIKVKDFSPVSEWLIPNLSIAPKSSIKGNYNNQLQDLTLYANSDLIKYNNLRFEKLTSKINKENTGLAVSTSLENLQITDSISLKNIQLNANANNNIINYNFTYNNMYKIKNSGTISGDATFLQNNKIVCKLNKSTIYLNDSAWNIKDSSFVHIDSNNIYLKNIEVSSAFGNQIISANGLISKNTNAILNIGIQNFNTANFNYFLRNDGIAFKGILNSNMQLSDILTKAKATANIKLDTFNVNNELLGNFNLHSTFDPIQNALLINGNCLRDDIKSIDINGAYYLNKENGLDIDLGLKNTPLKIINMFTEGVLSNVKGNISGKLKLLGNFNKVILDGNLNISDGGFKVDYLNTSYTFNHIVKFSENKIEAKNAQLIDEFGNTANTQFILKHNYFNKFAFDILLETEIFHSLNLNSTQNDLFYGKAFVSGYTRIRGPVNNITFDVSLKSLKGTKIYIPMSNTEEVGENDFIHFVKRDTTKIVVLNAKKLTGISMNMDLEITPEADAEIVFDEKVGDIIKGKGAGILHMELNSLGQFNMFGEYKIQSGDYLFTLKNILNKSFNIVPGGTITWTGNPYTADLNIAAIYNVKTSLTPILSTFDSSNVSRYNRPIPVACKLELTQKLLSPSVNFSIDLNNARIDQSIKDEFYASVRPDDIQEVNRQIFSLLLLGSFATPNGRLTALTGTTTSNGAQTNSFELLTNQFNQWMSGAIKGLDLSLKYRPKTENTGQQAEVNFSTQVLDERLSVEGNFGVNQYNFSNNATSNRNYFVSDMKVEYKLFKDGQIRLKAYNITNDVSALVNNSPYTQGVGIFYRKEFDNISELWKKKNSNPSKIKASSN